jgi:allantoicase
VDFTQLIDLAGERIGGAAILANDEFFAPKESLVRPDPAVWREGEYTERGKWMDGWETRRRRTPGYDWCVVRLGCPGIIRGVIVDTSYFTGNFPESCSLDACAVEGVPDAAQLAEGDVSWTEILPRSPLQGDARNAFSITARDRFTHVRLNIFPDGGVARLRIHGIVTPDWPRLARPGMQLDLAAIENGGLAVTASDMFYGNPQNMLLPGPSLGMKDGWETKRRRGPGNDWVVVRLGARGTLRRIVVDTSHFKGNAPGACSLEACAAAIGSLPGDDAAWHELVAMTRLQPHAVHEFLEDVRDIGPMTHVRLNIFPDGGVARLRLYGELASGPWR